MENDITVTLDDVQNSPTTELADVEGWVQEGWKRYKEPGWIPTKLVLSLRTKGRWAQVAKFFPHLVPPGEVIPPTEPPATGGQEIGDIAFGSTVRTDGLKGQPWQYARFVIPSGMAGKVSQVSYSEYPGYGGQQFTKRVSFSKVAGDFSVIRALGASGYVMVSFEQGRGGNTVTVLPGEVWYMNFDNRRENGEPSAGPTDDGDFQIAAGAPSVPS